MSKIALKSIVNLYYVRSFKCNHLIKFNCDFILQNTLYSQNYRNNQNVKKIVSKRKC